MIYNRFDVVVVPFPFTDRNTAKRRPALVLSGGDTFNHLTGNCVLAMITSAKNSEWPFDQEISNLKQTGLPSPSIIRMKLFTLDSRLILKKIGELSGNDRAAVKRNLKKLLPL